MISCMLLKSGKMPHFAKTLVISWVLIEILSPDMVTPADFTTVFFFFFFAPQLAGLVLEVRSRKQKTAFISNFLSL